jgi:hypothetical protein
VHFFKNLIKPFGDLSRAVRIADTFFFFFSGLTGGVDVFLSEKVLLIEAAALLIDGTRSLYEALTVGSNILGATGLSSDNRASKGMGNEFFDRGVGDGGAELL